MLAVLLALAAGKSLSCLPSQSEHRPSAQSDRDSIGPSRARVLRLSTAATSLTVAAALASFPRQVAGDQREVNDPDRSNVVKSDEFQPREASNRREQS